MSTPLGTDGARVRCLYCGANNFPAAPSCWQCGRTLQALPTGAAAPASGPGTAAPAAFAQPRVPMTSAPAYTALATKSAAALGLLFPPIALPVGMVFLMLDDPRKTRLGWITIGWSILGTILNVIFLVAPILALLKSFLPGAGHSGGMPALPPMPGGDTENILVLLHYSTFFKAQG